MLFEEVALETAEAAVRRGLALGATAAEATVDVGERFDGEAMNDRITKVERSKTRSLQVRLIVKRGEATFRTSDFSAANIDEMIAVALAAAKNSTNNEIRPLPDPQRCLDPEPLRLYSHKTAARPVDEKIAEALLLERLIRESDDRIVSTNGSKVGDSSGARALVNSNGLAACYKSTRAQRSTQPVARSGRSQISAGYGSASRSLDQMESVETVAQNAVRRTVGLLGARRPATQRLPIIFDRDVAASVLSDIFFAINGAAVCQRISWLADSLGQKVANENVTLVDDGTLPGLLGTAPFDSEGVPSQRTVVCERGILTGFLYDTLYGRRGGAASTGNAQPGGIGPSNFFLQPGELCVSEIVSQTDRGILVTDLLGFGTGGSAGTFSRGARGYMVEHGIISYPVEGFTIAGALRDMLGRIDLIANDLIFDARIASPTFRVSDLMVGGS